MSVDKAGLAILEAAEQYTLQILDVPDENKYLLVFDAGVQEKEIDGKSYEMEKIIYFHCYDLKVKRQVIQRAKHNIKDTFNWRMKAISSSNEAKDVWRIPCDRKTFLTQHLGIDI